MVEGMQLIGFSSEQASEVASWARSALEALRWCSFDGHPVPPGVVAGWVEEPGVLAHLLVEASVPVAYGELWVDHDEAEVELARLIVAPDHRRRGVGASLTRALVAEAHHHGADIFLRVRPDNPTALRLYQRVGFRRVDVGLETEWNAGQPVPYLWMQAPVGDR